MYPVDFKQKKGSLTYYPPLSAINPLRNQVFYCPKHLAKRNLPFENHRCNLFETGF